MNPLREHLIELEDVRLTRIRVTTGWLYITEVVDDLGKTIGASTSFVPQPETDALSGS